MTAPIYFIRDGALAFGNKPLFDGIDIYLYKKDRVCLIGRNGSGKSSLLKVIADEYEIDSGKIYKDPHCSIGYLSQEFRYNPQNTALEHVDNHCENKDLKRQKLDYFFTSLDLEKDKLLSELSGGQLRRVALATILLNQPDILLLDEPTNHLDISTIGWLEGYIRNYAGCIVCISHDKAFLRNVTNKLWWLDRANLRKTDIGFSYFDKWQEEILQQEENEIIKLNRKLNQEKIWLNQGVTARRKRNQNRLSKLKSLRVELQTRKAYGKVAKEKIEEIESSETSKSRFIIQTKNLSFCYDDKVICEDFDIRIKKGERVGIAGPNGAGKTTLIRLLLKEVEADKGNVKHGTDLNISYFSQAKESLDYERKMREIIAPNGAEFVPFQDKMIHISTYLKKFMFHPKEIDVKVKTLSGGEINRLLLAKLLLNPGNLLILDEPTNDLDMDSLEALLDILGDYNGTIILVSHDRDFIENLVTRTLIMDGSGKILDLYGGFQDYQNFLTKNGLDPKKMGQIKTVAPKAQDKKKNIKLSYIEQRKLDQIPENIDLLNEEIEGIEKKLADPSLYKTDQKSFENLSSNLINKRQMIEKLTEEWCFLEEKKDSLLKTI